MSKFKILHILKSNKYSGAENVVCQIIDMFKSEPDIKMMYCSPDGEIKKVLQKRHIEYLPMKNFSLSEIKKAVKKCKPNLIHAHDFSASVYAAVSTNIPIISHLHNNVPWMKKINSNSLFFLFSCFRYKNILVVSEAVANEFIFGKLIRNKAAVMGNPININEVREKSKEISEDLHEYAVIFLGRLSAPKNPKRFLQLMDKLRGEIKGVEAVMVGGGEMRKECEEDIKSLSLENTVHLAGFQENPYSFLKRAKVLCMPSSWEGFGLAAVEALALGLPVVCSNAGGLPGIVTDGCGKICVSDDDFIKEMQKLLSDEKYYLSKSKAAAERADMLSNIKEYKEKLNIIYRKNFK